MTNLEFYKDKLIDVLAEHTSVDKNGKPHTCDSVFCLDCAFSEENNCKKATKEWLLAEHKEKVKLKQWEYDLTKYLLYDNHSPKFNEEDVLMNMKEKGHFKSVTDTSMPLGKILFNCIIVADDYDGFEECK